MEETKVINVTEKANSFEFGPAGARHKVYYEDEEDLKEKIRAAKEGEKLLKQLEVV